VPVLERQRCLVHRDDRPAESGLGVLDDEVDLGIDDADLATGR